MTDIEYEELKERLKADGIFVEQTPTDNSKKHEYFRAFNEYTNEMHEQRYLHPGWGTLRDSIRKTVMYVYNAKRVTMMPDDKKEEANQLAIDICKLVIDRMGTEDK